MEWIETRLGRVPVWGEFNSERPLVLVIRGALPEEGHLSDLTVPDHDVALLHLPGFFSPALMATSIGAFIAAFDDLIGRRFADRQITVVGVSTGALVALGLRSAQVQRVLAVEPFFSTAKLWPLIELLQTVLRDNPGDRLLHDWIDRILGVTPERVEDRNYESVLARKDRPALMLVGREPLNPRRPVWGLPSLTDDSDRARLPYIEAPGGHDVPPGEIAKALARLQSLPRPSRRAPD